MRVESFSVDIDGDMMGLFSIEPSNVLDLGDVREGEEGRAAKYLCF